MAHIHAMKMPHGGSMNALHRNAPPTPHELLTKNSRKLVAQTFFGTLLKQMHDSPFKSNLFDGGRGGQAFSSMLDQHLADRMARGAGRKLVASMVRHIEQKNGVVKEPAEADKNKAPRKSPYEARFPSRVNFKSPTSARRSHDSADFRA